MIATEAIIRSRENTPDKKRYNGNAYYRAYQIICGVTLLVMMLLIEVIDAFQHRSSTAFLFHQHQHQHHRCYYYHKDYQERFIHRPIIRDGGTSILAESNPSSKDEIVESTDYDTFLSTPSSASVSVANDSWSTTAPIDQEFEYQYDNIDENDNENVDFDSDYIDDEDDEDEDFYKDFENFDYSSFLENKESTVSTQDDETSDEIDSASVSSSSLSSSDDNTTQAESVLGIKEPGRHTQTTPDNIKHQQQNLRPAVAEQRVHLLPLPGFNVVLTHCTADFDSLASAVGLAKLWSSETEHNKVDNNNNDNDGSSYDSSTNNYPTFVVLPRGAHPAVKRFLALHKHLFPIRSLKSLPKDLTKLNRLALVDAQRKDRIGPAEVLLKHANRVTVVDHHVDMESDIPNITDYVVDPVGSVSTLIVERLMQQQQQQQQQQQRIRQEQTENIASTSSRSPSPSPSMTRLTEAEATLLALGIHADTGSLCFDSTTPRDASALAWVMEHGASQVAIAEHAQSSLSAEQQKVLTQALVNANSTVVHGVTVTTVLLAADGFINGCTYYGVVNDKILHCSLGNGKERILYMYLLLLKRI